MNDRRRIGLEIKSLSNKFKRQIDKCVLSNDIDGITGVHCFVIGYIYRNSNNRDVFQKDIENEFEIRRSTATGILQLMEKNNLITREAVPYDARLKKLVLTEKAILIHKRIEHEIDRLEKKLENGLTEEERETFFRIADKISKNIEQ